MTKDGHGGVQPRYQKDIHPEDLQNVHRAIAHSIEHGPEHHVEYRIIRPDGAVRWVEGRGRVYRDESGAPSRLVGVCTDVTERKRVEEALKEADRAKDEFLAMLSHELRNPLAALTTAAHVLSVARPDQPVSAEARSIVDRQTRQMAHLVEDLLDVSRITMGKLALERETLDLASLAANLVDSWRSAGRIEHDRVSLNLEPAWVDADRVRIEQVIANLLDNALKFSSPRQPIKVSVRHDGGAALLQVSDEEEGIAPELISQVFEPFVQGAGGLARTKGGLGIGLALVKRLAELHGGSVSAASEGPGRGAVFTVRLPAVAGPAQQPARVPAQRAAGPRRVLIIEDNDDTRQMLRATLALDGHEVREAADGAAGLAAAADCRPDVALIDIGLPDIDGYEVARRLRSGRIDGAMLLIALTGYGQAEDQRRAREAGFDAHLTKPVAAERLAQAIAALR